MNSKEIAKLAGVSRSTVSRVINNYDNVPSKTKKKVMEIIDKYGYTPNYSAKALAGHTNDIIELVISDLFTTKTDSSWSGLNSPYNTQIIFSIIKECKKRNQLVLVNVIDNEKDLVKLENNYKNNFIRGGIYVGFDYRDQQIINLHKANYNIVAIDIFDSEFNKDSKIKTVNCLNYQACSTATEYLIKLGHQNIGFLEGDTRLSSIERRNGFIDTMNKNNLPLLPNSMQKGYFCEYDGYVATQKILNNKNITAIICSNDIMAYGAMKAIYEKNLKIPEDISLIGFDNDKLNYKNNLKLTSVYFDLKELAEKTVNAIFTSSNIHETCSCKIYEGSSVK
ncbi:MAG: LacI family DNA-binding transcriptional regulator [Pleomorphochaeta sp.]